MSWFANESEIEKAVLALCVTVTEAEQIIAASGVAVLEYVEKHFAGAGMSDDEWSTL